MSCQKQNWQVHLPGTFRVSASASDSGDGGGGRAQWYRTIGEPLTRYEPQLNQFRQLLCFGSN